MFVVDCFEQTYNTCKFSNLYSLRVFFYQSYYVVSHVLFLFCCIGYFAVPTFSKYCNLNIFITSLKDWLSKIKTIFVSWKSSEFLYHYSFFYCFLCIIHVMYEQIFFYFFLISKYFAVAFSFISSSYFHNYEKKQQKWVS